MVEEAGRVGREALCWLAGRLCVMVALEQDQPCSELVPDHRINILHTCLAWLLFRKIHFELILIPWPWIDVILGPLLLHALCHHGEGFQLVLALSDFLPLHTNPVTFSLILMTSDWLLLLSEAHSLDPK